MLLLAEGGTEVWKERWEGGREGRGSTKLREVERKGKKGEVEGMTWEYDACREEGGGTWGTGACGGSGWGRLRFPTPTTSRQRLPHYSHPKGEINGNSLVVRS